MGWKIGVGSGETGLVRIRVTVTGTVSPASLCFFSHVSVDARFPHTFPSSLLLPLLVLISCLFGVTGGQGLQRRAACPVQGEEGQAPFVICAPR